MAEEYGTAEGGYKNITQHVGAGTVYLGSSHGNLHLSDLSFTYVGRFFSWSNV